MFVVLNPISKLVVNYRCFKVLNGCLGLLLKR